MAPSTSRVYGFVIDDKVMLWNTVAGANSAAAEHDIDVETYEVKSSKPAPKKNLKTSSPAKGDDEEDGAPPTKKTRVSKPEPALPVGPENALHDLTTLFTGTMSWKRDSIIKCAMAHGASITRKIENCNYIVLGTKPGDTKLKEIESKEIPTVTEAEFVQHITTGVFPTLD